MIKKIEFCCENMKDSIKEDMIVQYDAVFRTYNIDIDDKSFKPLFYCPWCGVKLPKRLHAEVYDTLEKEYGLTTETLKFDLSNAPKEFQTDEWWKKRGL